MKNFLLTEETAKKVEALIKVPPYQFDARDFRVIERGKERIVSAVPQTVADRGANVTGPFMPVMRMVGAAYEVRITRGIVIELDRSAAVTVDAITLHEVDGIESAGEPVWHSITSGQCVYVKCDEEASGEIAPASADIVIDADGLVSLNTIPTVQVGIFYYKLAKFEVVAGVPRFTLWCAGSNIYHETGLTADFRIMTCPDPVDPVLYPAVQMARLRFASGRLAGAGEDVATVPLSDTVEEVSVEICT